MHLSLKELSFKFLCKMGPVDLQVWSALSWNYRKKHKKGVELVSKISPVNVKCRQLIVFWVGL